MYVLPIKTRDEWDTFCYYDKVFTPEECEQIIQMGNILPEASASISDQGIVDTTIRKNNIAWMDWNMQTDWIFRKISEVAQNANNNRYHFDLTSFLEPIQFTKYLEPSNHYEWHLDHGGGKFSIRKLSLVIQLSPDISYEGCDLEFSEDKLRLNMQAIRQQGTAIVFPSFERHRVTPLISGQRYSLVVWTSGPPFR